MTFTDPILALAIAAETGMACGRNVGAESAARERVACALEGKRPSLR